MQIVTKDNCLPCNKLKNMLNKLNVKYNECDISGVPENFKSSISGFPTVFLGTNILFSGSPGSLDSLKNLLIKAGVL